MTLFPALIITFHVLIGLALIVFVLLQHGKGADMGAGFGGGASASLFGATGSANFLSRTTAVLATIFFITSMGLAYMANSGPRQSRSVVDAPASSASTTAPAQSADTAPAQPPSKAAEIPK
jgi:preprotein translocase subunit SecG